MSTLAELQSATYDECGYAASPPTAITTRVTRNLNDGVRLVLSEPGFARLADSDEPLSVVSVASQARYTVTGAAAAIRKISERTNDRTLNALSLDQYRRMEPDPATVTGTPVAYVPIGKVAVSAQPVGTSTIFVVSANAGDTTQTVFLEGVSAGNVFTASVVLTGTTAVSFSARQFDQITDLYLSATTVGTVTLTEDSGVGSTLATIAAGQLRSRYYAFYLWPTPAAAITYLVDYRREIVDLANATDEPPLPLDYHPILVDYAVMREFEIKNDPQRVLIAQDRFKKRLSRLKYQTQTGPDELPVMQWGRRVGHSRLGPYFPADTWTRG